MPNATVDPNNTIHLELKSLEGGFVDIRPLPYGKKLERRDKAAKMLMRTDASQQGKGRMATQSDAVMEFETANEWAVQFDFAYCIVDHNLTDAKDVKLDFSNPMTIKLLDPRIGSEIEYAISDLNELEDEESFEDFQKRLLGSSEDTSSKSNTDSIEGKDELVAPS